MARKYIRKTKFVPPYETHFFETLELPGDDSFIPLLSRKIDFICTHIPANSIAIWLYLWSYEPGAKLSANTISNHFEISNFMYLDAMSILLKCNLIEFVGSEIRLKNGSEFISLMKYI